MSNPPLTRDLGAFVSSLRYEDVPAVAIQSVMTAFADTISVAVAGSNEDAPQLLEKMLAPTGNPRLPALKLFDTIMSLDQLPAARELMCDFSR